MNKRSKKIALLLILEEQLLFIGVLLSYLTAGRYKIK